MSVSSIGESLVILDKYDKVLMNGITYLDERGKETVEEIISLIPPEELYDITRIPLSHMY